MTIADQFPETNLTVGQPVGWLGRSLIAAAVTLTRVATNAKMAVHHKESISGPARRATRQVVDSCSSDVCAGGHEWWVGRSSQIVSPIFFLCLAPYPPSRSERNEGFKSCSPSTICFHYKKSGSSLVNEKGYGFGRLGRCATLKSNFLWNFGISENRVACLSAGVAGLARMIWALDAISVMTARG